MPTVFRATIFALAVLLMPLAGLGQEFYFNDFDGGETFGAGVAGGLSGETATEPAQGFVGLGPVGGEFSGNLLRSTSATQPGEATVLELSGLPPHDDVSIGFLFAAIDSWDGAFSPGVDDFFEVWLDGEQIFQETFLNSTAASSQSYAGPALALRQALGFTAGIDHNDSAYDMLPNFGNVPHSADTLTLEFFASGLHWQGGTDESWGMDNLRVAVPEPGHVAQLGVGALVLALACARRRASRFRRFNVCLPDSNQEGWNDTPIE